MQTAMKIELVTVSATKNKISHQSKKKPTFKRKLRYSKKAETEAKQKSKSKSTTIVPISINIDELEKLDMSKNRPLAENTCCEWYDWLISHVLVKQSASIFNKKPRISLKQIKDNILN